MMYHAEEEHSDTAISARQDCFSAVLSRMSLRWLKLGKTYRASYSRSAVWNLYIILIMSILAVVLTASIEFNSYISRSAVIRQLITAYQSVKSLSVNVEIN